MLGPLTNSVQQPSSSAEPRANVLFDEPSSSAAASSSSVATAEISRTHIYGSVTQFYFSLKVYCIHGPRAITHQIDEYHHSNNGYICLNFLTIETLI